MTHPAQEQDQWIGRVVGQDFRIESLLGEGGFGSVYLARQLSVDRDVVVKVIKRSLTDSDKAVQRFRREALIVARLSHPNIVQVYTAGETDDGAQYLVMEYVRGPTLHDLLHSETHLDEARSLRIAEQIAGALAAAHSAGVVHRDLKPANVILTAVAGKDELAKVLDFGIAKLLEHDDTEASGPVTESGAIIGTPAYMSPEQVSGLALDGRSDIYTLGLMLYEMLTGKHPFDAETPVQYIIQHLQEPITPPAVRLPGLLISGECESILDRCCAKDRGERFPSAEALHLALKRLADRLETSADPATHALPPGGAMTSSTARPGMPPRDADHRRALVSLAVVFALLGFAVVGGAALYILRSGSLADEKTLAGDETGANDEAAANDETTADDETTDSEKPAAPAASGAAVDRRAGASATVVPAGPASAAAVEPVPARRPANVGAEPDDKPPSYGTRSQRTWPPPAGTTPTSPPSVIAPSATLITRPDGPYAAPLPVGSRLRMRADTLVSYAVPFGVAALAEVFQQEFADEAGVMFNSDRADDAIEPFFSVMLTNREFGVTMISVIHTGVDSANVNYFVTAPPR